jgi:hypothetical protein
MLVTWAQKAYSSEKAMRYLWDHTSGEMQYHNLEELLRCLRDLRENLVSYVHLKCICGKRSSINRFYDSENKKFVYKCTGYSWDKGCGYIVPNSVIEKKVKELSENE